MNKHEQHVNNKFEWYTPAPLMKDMIRILTNNGRPDHAWCDPCTSRAAIQYHFDNNIMCPEVYGVIDQPWREHDWEECKLPMWCNPPYGRNITQEWVDLLIKYQDLERPTMVLLPANTSSKWFHQLLTKSQACLLLEGRLSFFDPEIGKPRGGNTGGSAIFIMGSTIDMSNRLLEWLESEKKNGRNHTIVKALR
jgi:hypothetical protein